MIGWMILAGVIGFGVLIELREIASRLGQISNILSATRRKNDAD